MTRPETLLSVSDYVEDIKARWAIHQYEMKKLGEDLSSLRKFISEKTSQFSDLMYYTWAETVSYTHLTLPTKRIV